MWHCARNVLALLVLGNTIFGQSDSASLRFWVTDTLKGSVAGARLIAIQDSTGRRYEGLTSDQGNGLFSPISPGVYTVTVTKAGFRPYTLKNLRVEVQSSREVNVALEVESVTEAIEVVATEASLQTAQGSLGQVIGGKTAIELPLAARRYVELALLVPGVAPSTMTTQTRGPGWIVSNGNYPTQNNFILDGVDNNQGTTNAQALSSQVVQPSPDSIAEFKVQTNSFSAEFGRSAGSVVNVSLKSGSNAVHGSAWHYNRDKSLAATPWNASTFGQPKPDLKWNQPGGTIGGPLRKDKIFYFGDYEGFLQDFSQIFLTTLPSVGQRTGEFNRVVNDPNGGTFPDNRIPASRFDVLGKKLVDLYPVPNVPGTISGGRPANNYSANRGGTERTHKYNIRTDFVLSEKDSLMVRFSYLYQKFNREGIFPGLADGVGNQGVQKNDNQSSAIAWTRVLSPKVINVARFGLNRTYAAFAHASADLARADEFGFLGFPAEMLQTGGLPLINPTNYNSLGTRNFRPQFQRPYLIQFLDTVSMNSGSHAIKAGFEIRDKRNTFIDSTRRTPAYDFSGEFTGDAMSDLILGLPRQITVNTVPEIVERQRAWSGFLQDDWKVRNRFTVNLGLRYEYTTPFYGSGQNRNINLDLTTRQLVTASDQDRYLVRPDRNNFGPRLGFSWELLPGRLVLRGGYGAYFSGEDVFGSDANLTLNPPQQVQVVLTRAGSGPPPVLLSAPLPANILSQFRTSSLQLRTRDRDMVSASIQQWNLALQSRIGEANTFELAYVGNRGRNLWGIFNANQTPFGVDGSIPANRPFPEWGQVQRAVSTGKSWYDALQAKFDRRMFNHWQMLASYTFARAIDQTGSFDSVNLPQVADRFDLESGPMAQLSRQRLSVSNIVELPLLKNSPLALRSIIGGWQLSTITSARSGLPVPVAMNRTGTNPATGQTYAFFDRNGSGFRPNRIGPGTTGLAPSENRLRYLDGNAFQIPALNTAGNSQRNPVYGPSAFNLDVSLVKRFPFGERAALDIRGEAFNLLNIVNYGNPASAFGSPNFGQITSAGEARVVQLAARFRF